MLLAATTKSPSSKIHIILDLNNSFQHMKNQFKISPTLSLIIGHLTSSRTRLAIQWRRSNAGEQKPNVKREIKFLLLSLLGFVRDLRNTTFDNKFSWQSLPFIEPITYNE
jgi:hypothetical protein